MKIVSAFANDMGTSIVLKTKIQKICNKLGVNPTISVESASNATALVDKVDIIITSQGKVSTFQDNKKAKIVGIENMLDDNEIENKIKPLIK